MRSEHDFALLWVSLAPKTDGDGAKLRPALARLAAGDPMLTVMTDRATGEVSVGGIHELQLEIVIDRLRREFDVEAHVGRPQIAYWAGLTRTAEGEAKSTERTGDRGQYGHVKVRVFPGEPGAGYIFENHVLGGAIPDRFIGAVEEGFRDAASRGVRGYPFRDIRVELHDGSYHDVDSSHEAFRIAASMAFSDAASKAGPILLEPVIRVSVVVPDEHLADVVVNLSARRGHIDRQGSREGMKIVQARVPLAEMFGYAVDLRERTRGRGSFTVAFDRYQPCQPPKGEGGGESLVGAPRRPRPAPKQSHVALPEPDDPQPGTGSYPGE
jgi:elongation factor G